MSTEHSNPTATSPNQPNAAPTHGTSEHESAPEQKPIRTSRGIAVVVIAVVVLAVLAVLGILPRQHALAALDASTRQLAAPSVIVATAKPGAPVEELNLPGNVTAYTDAPIYARTPGYLSRWYFDIGARVKRGALLAEIATPEVDSQLTQAEADLGTAEANANNARIQADRSKGLVASNSVSQQDTDTYTNLATSTAAQVRSALANVQRLRDLKSFEKIYAPFDGVITARNIDTGQLIDAGSAAGAGKELFHMQAVQTLRIYTSLPAIFSGSAKVGASVDVSFPENPGQLTHGKLVRTSDSIDPVSRTLLVEIDVDNRGGKLLAGSLAQVHFKVAPVGTAFIVPVSALIFRAEGLRVATVKGSIAHMAPVTIGEDDGRTVQINTGLTKDDLVIQDPPDSLIDGEQVHVLTPDEVRTASQGGN